MPGVNIASKMLINELLSVLASSFLYKLLTILRVRYSWTISNEMIGNSEENVIFD